MLNLIKANLKCIIDNIDTGNTEITESEQNQLLHLLQEINRQELSRIESANFLGVSVSTFDNYRKQGKIPPGIKRQGLGLVWNKSDLSKVNLK